MGIAPTSWWGRYPKSTNNLDLFSTEEFQIICTLGIICHLSIPDNPKSIYSWGSARTNWWGRGPWALPGAGTVGDGGPGGRK